MQVGIPKDSLAGKTRVAAMPESVKKLCAVGYQIFIESGTGLGAHFTDKAYSEAGAKIVDDLQALSAPIV